MLTEVFEWWSARMQELVSAFLPGRGASQAVIVRADPDRTFSAFMRRGNRLQPVTLTAVPRVRRHGPVLFQVPPDAVLEKTHVVPPASRGELAQMLRHEISRITPFQATELYWRFRTQPAPNDRSKMLARLTMVPRTAVSPALAALRELGVQPTALQAGADGVVLSLSEKDAPRAGVRLAGGLCIALALAAMILPFAWQEVRLLSVQRAIDDLKPQVQQAEALRREAAGHAAGQDIAARQLGSNGDIGAVLAALTEALPDDTYLTDLALRRRQVTLTGRSASAPSLIAVLAASPVFRNVAFSAPVTRAVGGTADVFTIRAEVAGP
jgi:general secretion pathway protein L